MHNLTAFVANKAFARLSIVTLLSIGAVGLTACSSPEEDAEARGDNVEMTTNAQDSVVKESMQEDTDSMAETDMVSADKTPAQNVDSGVSLTDNTTQTDQEGSNTSETSTVVEGADIDNNQLGTHDNDDIADGTDKEEHVSTY